MCSIIQQSDGGKIAHFPLNNQKNESDASNEQLGKNKEKSMSKIVKIGLFHTDPRSGWLTSKKSIP